MYQEFSILSINTKLKEKKITIETNHALNENSINDIEVEIIKRKDRTNISFDLKIYKNILIITLSKSPSINEPYILHVNGIKNLLNEICPTIKKRIIFESSIVEEVEIISPIMHEEVNALNFKHNIKNATENFNYVDYHIKLEIATDNAFYNIIKTSEIFDNENKIISGLKIGQFFLRARVENEKEVGEWSKTISFVYKKEICNKEEDDEDLEFTPNYEDMTDDIYIDDVSDFDVEINVEDGTTPEELILLFTKDLDENEFDSSQIKIYRREIR